METREQYIAHEKVTKKTFKNQLLYVKTLVRNEEQIKYQQEALWATLIRAGAIDTCHHVKGIEFLKMESFSQRLFTSVCRAKKQKKN